MWYVWLSLWCVVWAEPLSTRAPARAPARSPARTLDRQAAELAWRSWLQSPESGNQNAPPRRITTKSLFITPLVCPKGQRLDQNGCVQVLTVNQDEHERLLLEQLNALFTSAPSGDVVYDYGDDEPGPLQLTIPIGSDPQAAPLQGQEPAGQAHDLQPNFVNIDKKDETGNKADLDTGIVAELELLKLQNTKFTQNDTKSSENTDILNHDVLTNFMIPQDKPKRDSHIVNETELIQIKNITDEGQKELVYGHVNVDPVLYGTDVEQATTEADNIKQTEQQPLNTLTEKVESTNGNGNKKPVSAVNVTDSSNSTVTNTSNTSSTHELKKDDKVKLNPESDYGDIGEAIKLISRYAEVTTDDNFNKDQKKYAYKDDSILGTRTKLQHRRNKIKTNSNTYYQAPILTQIPNEYASNINIPNQNAFIKKDVFYRYPWQVQNPQTPPADYPFRHLQDYWNGRIQVGGVYNTAHENPRRHHHTYPHNYFKTHDYAYPGSPPANPESFPGQGPRSMPEPVRSHSSNQDLYSLLGLRHWFSSESSSKR